MLGVKGLTAANKQCTSSSFHSVQHQHFEESDTLSAYWVTLAFPSSTKRWHTQSLCTRSPDEDLLVLHLLLLDEADTQDDPGEVTQVEDVVGLGRRGQQVLHSLLVHLQRGRHDLGAHGEEVGGVLLTLEKEQQNFYGYPGVLG